MRRPAPASARAGAAVRRSAGSISVAEKRGSDRRRPARECARRARRTGQSRRSPPVRRPEPRWRAENPERRAAAAPRARCAPARRPEFRADRAVEKLCRAGLPKAVGFGGAGRGPLERQARAALLVDQEQQAGLRRDGDLGVIAGGFECLVALEQRGVQLVGALQMPRAAPARPCDGTRGRRRPAPAVPARQRPSRRNPRRPGQRCGRAGRPRPAPPSPRKRRAAPAPDRSAG